MYHCTQETKPNRLHNLLTCQSDRKFSLSQLVPSTAGNSTQVGKTGARLAGYRLLWVILVAVDGVVGSWGCVVG
ncbi:hypothetical protein [Nostoc sp.]|uniref:hypothetical protein n=1 Tax=Nostoc sp. TaxID=1180 RepID=UPI002FFAED1A